MPRFVATRIRLWASHSVALLAAVVAAVGLWVCLLAVERSRAMGAASSTGSGLAVAAWMGLPHVVALAAAFLSRRHLGCSAMALAGTAINTWLTALVWRADGANMVPYTLAMVQTWVVQFLVMSLPVAAGIEGWRNDRCAAAPLPTAPGDG